MYKAVPLQDPQPVAIAQPQQPVAVVQQQPVTIVKHEPVAVPQAQPLRFAECQPVSVATRQPVAVVQQPTLAVRSAPSAQMIAIMQQADGINRHAFELAQRGAIYSARAEFLRSLHLIATALDSQGNGRQHQIMLAAGMRALDEADDFIIRDPLATTQVDVAQIVGGHQTTILKNQSLDKVSPQEAVGRYLTYAQLQLAGSAGDLPPGSAALFGLGKIFSVPVEVHGPLDSTGGAKAVVYYEAALDVDGRNYPAANELGVVLAYFGRLPEARAALQHSLSIAAQPVAWRNLATVHERMGETELAARARQSAVVAAKQGGASQSTYNVDWVDAATFASSMPVNTDPIRVPASTIAQPQARKNVADATSWWTGIKRQ